MKYIEILDKSGNCEDCYVEGEFTQMRSLPLEGEKYYTYRWNSQLSKIPEPDLVVAEAYQQPLSFGTSSAFAVAEAKMKAHIAAAKTAKIHPAICLYDIIPDHIYKEFCAAKSQVIEEFLQNASCPPNYEHFLGIQKLLSTVSSHEIILDPSKVTSTKQMKIIRSGLNRVIYDPSGTATGRLTTKRGSFPVMTLAARDRAFVVPSNDILVEFDYNAAEIRTLLALSGHDQPDIDIHEYNAQQFSNPIPRREAKESFFAWLYNRSRKSRTFGDIYDKNIYKKFFEEEKSMIKTPFGRKLKVDETRALNYLLQSTSSDLMLEQALKVSTCLNGGTGKSFVKFLMHDSVILDVDRVDLPLLGSILEVFAQTRLGKYVVNVKHGTDFLNLRALKWRM